MAQDPSAVNARTRPDREGMTRDEILALFDRHQKAYDDLDATRLAADYAPNASVQSPMSGTHQGTFVGIEPTGRRFAQRQVHILRMQDGKAVEHWAVRDDLGFMQQLGAAPAQSTAA